MRTKLTKVDINTEDFAEKLFKHRTLVIQGLGRFDLRKIKSRKFLLNMTNKIVTTKSRYKVHFTPYAKLKKLCRE